METATARKVIPAEIEPDFLCSICQDLLVEPVAGLCGHQFCKHCLESWRVANLGPGLRAVCPECRGVLFASSSQSLGVCRLLERMLQQTYPDRYATRLAQVASAKTKMQAQAQKQLGTHMAAVHELILGALPGLRARSSGIPAQLSTEGPQHTLHNLTNEQDDAVQNYESTGRHVSGKESSQHLYQRRTISTELPPIVLVPTDGTAPVSVPATPATPLLPSLIAQSSPAVANTVASSNVVGLPFDTQSGASAWVSSVATRLPPGRLAYHGVLPSSAPASVAQQKSQGLLLDNGSQSATACHRGPAKKRQRQSPDMHHVSLAPDLHALADIALQQRDEEIEKENASQPYCQPSMVKPSKRSNVGKSGAPLPPLPRTKAGSTGGALTTQGRQATPAQQPMSPPASMFSSLSSVFDGWASQAHTGGGSVIGCEPSMTQNFVRGGPVFGPAAQQYQQPPSRQQLQHQVLERPVSHGARSPLQPLQLNGAQDQLSQSMAAFLDLKQPSASQSNKVTSASSNSLSAVSHTVTPLDLDLPITTLDRLSAATQPGSDNRVKSPANANTADKDSEAAALITDEKVLEAADISNEEELQQSNVPNTSLCHGQVLPQLDHVAHPMSCDEQLAATCNTPHMAGSCNAAQTHDEGDMKEAQHQQLSAISLREMQLHNIMLQQPTETQLAGHMSDMVSRHSAAPGLHLQPDAGNQTLIAHPATAFSPPGVLWDSDMCNQHANQQHSITPSLLRQPVQQSQSANPCCLHDDQVRQWLLAGAVPVAGMQALAYHHGRQILFEQPSDSSHYAAAVSNQGCNDDDDEVWPGAPPLAHHLSGESISFAFGSVAPVHNSLKQVATLPGSTALADEHVADCQQPMGLVDTQEAADETDGEVAADKFVQQACSQATTPVHATAHNSSLPGYMDTGCSAKKQRASLNSTCPVATGTDAINATQPTCVLSDCSEPLHQDSTGQKQTGTATDLTQLGLVSDNKVPAASCLLASLPPSTSAEPQPCNSQAMQQQSQPAASHASGNQVSSAGDASPVVPHQHSGPSKPLSSLPPPPRQQPTPVTTTTTQQPAIRQVSNNGIPLLLAPNDRLRLSHPCLVKPGSWHHLERDIPMRMAVVQSIIEALLSKLPGRLAEDRLPAFHKCISKVEEVLYMGAASAEAYSDRSTLMTRFLALRKQLLDAAGRRATTA